MTRFIPDELAARAMRVLQPLSAATPAERRQARQLLRDYERQELSRRIALDAADRPEPPSS